MSTGKEPQLVFEIGEIDEKKMLKVGRISGK